MKIALIGNMNNNHFSLLRYLRDLKLDCELLIFRGEASHFKPDCDTHNLNLWKPYIKHLTFTNGGLDIIRTSKKNILLQLSGYDFYIGNGITPALFRFLGLKLDIFIPYGGGIEFIIDSTPNYKKPFRSFFKFLKKRYQIKGLKKNTKIIISSDFSDYNLDIFNKLKINPIPLDLPMLYLEHNKEVKLNYQLNSAVARMKSCDIVVFSHVSHFWKNLPFHNEDIWVGKRNDWLIIGFTNFIKKAKNKNCCLVLFEYGPDVDTSKSLIHDLGISKYVIWFPVLDRKTIMYLLQFATIGGSEFSGELWGGTGWEFLASGVPMFHMLDDTESFVEEKKIPLPPFFNVKSGSEITHILLQFENNITKLHKMGDECKEWFKKYNAYPLATKYKELILKTYDE